ncbi:MarR family winged helix-turn-helix transcriptional regulator [Solwaraspora sp. WMMB335]|uniref:MarR family winged helix-turn-helix transcriptional regulator n=1 Tax=Solwaraspora sp. WMMB335 TaxID=3404118 RepID=UPI003B9605A0
MPSSVEPAQPASASAADGGDLGWALGVVFRAYLKAADRILDDLPGGPRGHQVLAAAVQGAPQSQIALARRLGIDKTVMTYLIDDLEKVGLVERRAHPDDRRHKQVVATEQGSRIWAATRQRLDHAEDQLLGPLSPADRTELRSLLHRLAERAQRIDPVADTCQIVSDITADQH